MSVAVQAERQGAIDLFVRLMREHYVYGPADVRLVLDGVPRDLWDDIDSVVLRSFSGVEFKRIRPAIGSEVQLIPAEER